MTLSALESVASPDAPDTAAIVEATLRRCGPIATLPAITTQIIRLSEDPSSTSDDMHKVIAKDPALSVRVLKLVNSAYYGMPHQVNSIQRAILLLGLRAVKNVAIAASLVKLFRSGVVGPEFDAGNLWTHSIAVATGARLLARQTGLAVAEEAFLAGLIHDTGILVEMQACGPNFARMIQKVAADESLAFRAAEEEVLGASHEAFGAGLCQAWNFPSSLQYVTGYHHRPWDVPEADRGLPTLIHIADVLAARSGLGYTRTVETDSVSPELLSSIHLAEPDLDEIAERLPEAMQESQQSLSEGK
jgi:HD-like signal output (HDOD) protein